MDPADAKKTRKKKGIRLSNFLKENNAITHKHETRRAGNDEK